MNSFANSFRKSSASQQSSNLPPHLVQDPKDLASFPLGIDPATLLALQSQQPQLAIPQYQKLSRPLQDAEDLDAPSKIFKANNGSINVLAENQKQKLPAFQIPGSNKPNFDQQLQRESRIGPDLRHLGVDMQMQPPFLGNNLLNTNFPSLEALTKGQLSFPPDQNLLGLNAFTPEMMGQKPSEPLVMSDEFALNSNNLAREQALRNMLLLQALQNPMDLLSNRLSPLQQQLQLLGNPQLQAAQSLRMPSLNGMNPLLAYQYLDMQKRLENEYAAMQARAQMIQAAQRLQSNEWAQTPQLSELLDPRRQLEGFPLEKIENSAKHAEYMRIFEENKANAQKEQIEKQKRGSEFDLRGMKNENLKTNVVTLQNQQQFLHHNGENKQINLNKTNHVVQSIKLNGQKSEIKKEPERIQREMPKYAINEKFTREPIQRINKEMTRYEPMESAKSRETRRTTQSQLEFQQIQRNMEEDRILQAKRERNERAQRYNQRYESDLSYKPVQTRVIPSSNRYEVDVGIIQNKERFAAKLREGYTIEINSPHEKRVGSMKRTPIGRLHQAIIQDLELNDNHKMVEESKRPYKLKSKPTEFFGIKIDNDLDNPYFDPMTKVEGLKSMKK